MSSSTTTTTTTTSIALEDPVRARIEALGSSQQVSIEQVDGEGFLTHNGSPIGLEPVNNPPGWPTNRRRVPPYRAPVINPAWNQIAGDTVGIRTFMWTMLRGFQLLQWSYMVPRSLGLHTRGLGMYQIANEW